MVLINDGKVVYYNSNNISENIENYNVNDFEEFLLSFTEVKGQRIRSRVLRENTTAIVIIGKLNRNRKEYEHLEIMSEKIGANLDQESMSSIIGIPPPSSNHPIEEKLKKESKTNEYVKSDTTSQKANNFEQVFSIWKNTKLNKIFSRYFPITTITIASLVLLIVMLPNFNENIDNIMIEAKYDISEGNFQKAINSYEKILGIAPDNMQALNGLGTIHFTIENYDEALLYFNKVLGIAPDNMQALNGLGMVYIELENYDEALLYFNKVLGIAPDNMQALNGLGMVYIELENYDEALLYFNKVLGIAPDNTVAMRKKAQIFIDLEEYFDALFWTYKVLEVEPDNENALIMKKEITDKLQ